MPSSKQHRNSPDAVFTPDSVYALPNRYFLFADKQQTPTLAIADEDTIIYLREQHGNQVGLLVAANKKNKRILSIQYLKKDRSRVAVDFDQERKEILDTSEFGDRWEGPILNDMPLGWGLCYDRNGELVYEGFSVFGKCSLYGMEYDSKTHTVLYQGMMCDDRRYGRGVLYDKTGAVVYDGEWVDDDRFIEKVVTVPESAALLPPIHSLVVSLRIDDSSCNDEHSLILHRFPRLRELYLGSESFSRQSEEESVFSCVDCPELRVIEFGGSGVMMHFNRMIITGEKRLSEMTFRQSQAAFHESALGLHAQFHGVESGEYALMSSLSE